MSVGALKNAWAIDTTPEAAFNTAAAVPDKRHPFRGTLPKLVTETAGDDDTLQGIYEDGTTEVITKQIMNFNPEFDLRLDPLATYLKYVFGTLTTGAPVSTIYPHTCTLNAGDAPSFTGYAQDFNTTATKLMRYTGCKVKSLTIKSQKGSKMTFSVEIIGSGIKSEQVVALPALSAPTEAILTHAMISAFTINAVNYMALLEGFEITFTNDLAAEDGYAAGATTLQSNERTKFSVSGKADLYWDGTESQLVGIIPLVEAKTPVAIVLTATSGTSNFTINAYRTILDAPEPQGAKGKQKLPVTFKGKYDTSAAKAAQVLVNNATVAYT